MYTLLLTWRLQSWHKGNCTPSAHHHSFLQTAQCDLGESHTVRGTQAIAASLRDFPLSWRRNTQIQMYWLWKWLESYNNCTFSTWKDIFVFSLLFWIPNSFCTCHDYGRGGTPFLASPDGRHWFFIIHIFEQLSCHEKQSCPETFHCVEIFFIFQDFWATCGCPEKQSVPWIHCIKCIFLIIQNLEQLALALKNRVCPEVFHCVEIFFVFQDFCGTCACPENRVCHEILHCINILLHSGCLSRVCPDIFHCIEYSF